MSFDNQKKILSKNNPIDFIEEYVLNYEIEKVRDSRDEIIIFSKGVWRNYDISFRWDSKRKIIEIITYFEMSKKNRINKSIYSLISGINKKATVGFFNYCTELNTIFFSYKISFKGQDFISVEQIKNFINIVISECDRFFPVFFVFFYKKQDPIHALDIALLDTIGEA